MEDGLKPIKMPGFIRNENTFISGDPESEKIRTQYFRRDKDGRLIAKVWFGPQSEGPPNCVHGGAIAAVLDEAMGAATWIAGHTVIGAKLTVKYRRPVPIDSHAEVEARVDKESGRRLATVAVLRNGGGETLAEGEGLYFCVAPEELGRGMDRGPDYVEEPDTSG